MSGRHYLYFPPEGGAPATATINLGERVRRSDRRLRPYGTSTDKVVHRHRQRLLPGRVVFLCSFSPAVRCPGPCAHTSKLGTLYCGALPGPRAPICRSFTLLSARPLGTLPFFDRRFAAFYRPIWRLPPQHGPPVIRERLLKRLRPLPRAS